MALACSPKVLLADEPTTALDVMVQAQILNLLTELTDDLGLALVLVTHDLPVVGQTCHRVSVMYAGEVIESGSVETLYHSARHPYTRLLFGTVPSLHGTGPLVSIPGTPPRLDTEPVGCPFRPRCPDAMDVCARDRPLPVALDDSHLAACHLIDRTRSASL